ncbi:MAG TPA: hypothetical protein VG755_37860 [Nannocystaceae bacterium]|nr:hypothetical protein [Nannocystaceae bacterium]
MLRLLVSCCASLFLFTGLTPIARAGEPAKPTTAVPEPSAKPSDSSTKTSKTRYADVAVETQSLGAAGPVVRRRVGERADVVLRRSGVLPPRDGDDPVISVTVEELTGDEPGYVFRVEILVNGVATEKAKPTECRLCTEGELVDAIEGRLEHAVANLPTAGGDVPPPRVDPTPQDPIDAPMPEPAPRPGMRIAGAAVLGVGAAALIAGAVMAARKDTVKDNPLELSSTHTPGYALIGVGGAAVITGAVLLIVDARRRAKYKRSTTAKLR